MTADQLARRHPTLYHMADARNRGTLRSLGLLSTTALLDRFALAGPDRDAVEAAHRPATVRIPAAGPHPRLGHAYVRDQRPLDESALAKCLTGGLTVAQWYRMLNGRVYFWPTRDRLDRMLKVYTPTAEQVVLEVDTAALCDRHGDAVELSHINSGFASRRYPPARRGADTFVPLAEFVHSARNTIAEVTVPYAVPDVLACVRSATLYHAGKAERVTL